MRLQVFVKLSAFILLVWLGCAGNPGDARTSNTSSSQHVSKNEATSLAERAAREQGYDLKVYESRTVRKREGWLVLFTHAPPTIPSAHFTVYVNRITREVQLVPGP